MPETSQLKFTRALARAVLVALIAVSSLLPDAPRSLAQEGLTWTQTNGPFGGKVNTLLVDGLNPSIVYAGTSNGLHQSLRLARQAGPVGLCWQPAPQGLPRDEVKCVTVDERSPQAIYAALGTGPGMIYRSTDSGSTWVALSRDELPTSVNIQALAVHSSRRRPTILYVGTDAGVFRSQDGEASWRAVNTALPARANLTALLLDANHSYLYANVSNSGAYRTMDKEKGLISWPVAIMVLLALAALSGGTLWVVHWYLHSSEHAQEERFERDWPLWRGEIQHVLQDQNEVPADALPFIPPSLRTRALQRYFQEHGEDNLVLRLNPPVLEPANSLQVWDFMRNWRAAQKRLNSPAAFKPVVSRICEQLCQLLGFGLLDSRSYKTLHGFLVKAPALRLRIPPVFPIVFMQTRDLREEDISQVRDMMGILNVSSYLAVLIVPGDGASAGRDQELRTRFRRLVSGAADDFIVMDLADLYRIFVSKDPGRKFVSLMLEQVDLTVVSPYVTSGPVPENMFFGRDYELKTITRTIKDSDFAIVGGRKIGKTSILTKLHRLFSDSAEYYPLYLDCQAVQDYGGFRDAIETIWKLPLTEASPECLMRLVARMKQEREGQLIVILLDEVDALLKHDASNQERLFKVFRALSQEGHCRFIFCGERVLYSSLQDPGSAFFNFCNIIRLSFLNARDAGRVILEPLQEMGIGLEDASKLVQGIIDLSACHPNIVQYICQELILLINRRGDRFITLEDLTSIGNSNQFKDYLIAVRWGNATPLERLITLLLLDRPGLTVAQIVEALQAYGVQLPPERIERSLDALILGSVLSREEHEYRCMALPFPTAVAAAYDVPALLERIVEQVRNEASQG